MAFLRGLFWFALFLVLTFCFVVLFEYGPARFYQRSSERVCPGKIIRRKANGRNQAKIKKTAEPGGHLRRTYGESFYRQGV